MTKTRLLILIAICLLIIGGIGFFTYVKFFNEDGWICQNGQWVKHGNPNAPQPMVPCVGQNNFHQNSIPANTNNQNQTPTNTNSPSNLNQNPTTNPNIKVDFPQANDLLQTPATISGQAKLWYFEGSFPYKLLDENGQVLANGQAEAQGEWMTEQFVPFKATLTFVSAKDQNGTLVLMNDNPSGLPALDEKIEIPVRLAASETMLIKVFFGNELKNPGAMDCSKVFGVERKIIKTASTAKASLIELLNGPTAEELNNKYFTSLNSGIKLQKITIKDGIVYADFDKTLEEAVGGSCRVTAIRAQITQTLKQFSSIKDVVISIDGRTEDILQP